MLTIKSTVVLFSSALVMGIGIKVGSDLYSWIKFKVVNRMADTHVSKMEQALVYKATRDKILAEVVYQ